MKKILYVILGLFAIYLILCLIGPSNIKVERSIVINAPKNLLKEKLADLKFFQEQWSPWTEKDTAMKVVFEGTMGEPGSNYSWESDKKDVGKGKMIYNQTVNDTIFHTLLFEGMGDTKVYYILSEVESATNVLWGMTFDVGFFGRAIMLFVNMEEQAGPDFDKGLANLKTKVESASSTLPDSPKYEIKELQWEGKTFYGKKETLSFDKMGAFFEENYGKIGEALGKAKAQPIGMPKAIYYSFDEATMIAECAAVMEVANGVKLDGLEKFESPASKVLLIEYYGAYEKSANAHHAMDDYIKSNGLKQGLVIEEYVTDPMTEKDTTKWLTNIYYQIQ